MNNGLNVIETIRFKLNLIINRLQKFKIGSRKTDFDLNPSVGISKMATKTPNFPAIVEKAKKEHYYNKASKSGTLLLSGAAKKFGAEPGIMYLPIYRVVGTLEEITKYLTGYGVTLDQDTLNTAYTAQNYKDNPNFTAEVAALKVYQNGNKVAKEPVTLAQVASAPKASSSTGKGKPILERYQNLPEDKVIDCTNCKPNGTGCREVARPKHTTKYQTVGYPFQSTTLEGLELACKLVGITPEIRQGETVAPPAVPKLEPKIADLPPLTNAPTNPAPFGLKSPVGNTQVVLPLPTLAPNPKVSGLKSPTAPTVQPLNLGGLTLPAFPGFAK